MDIISGTSNTKKLTKEEQLESLFNDLITKNSITKDVKIGDLTITIKSLQTDEYLEAETIQLAASTNIPKDVINRVRILSTLSYAIVAINGIKIEEDNKKELRNKVYKLIMKLPPPAIDYIYSEYLKLVNQQSELFVNLSDNLENF